MRGTSSVGAARTGRCYCFFFSSRRRHTRLQGDWSSDVCSSDLPPLTAICAAGPAVPVAVNVTGLPESVPDEAVSVLDPAVVDSVQPPTVAIPLASVVCVAPVTLPLAGPGANVTDTPEAGLPNASVTITDGGTRTAVPAGARWPLPPSRALLGPPPAPPPTLA